MPGFAPSDEDTLPVGEETEVVSEFIATAVPSITAEEEVETKTTDKWLLWVNGTQLRGANIWQRIVVPELDGTEFLGDGYIGPPYTQADFDNLATLGANYVNISHPGLFTERPSYKLDEKVQANLDRLIGMAEQADLFVVITFRTGPGRSDFTFYRDGAGDWFDEDLLIENVWTEQDAQAAWVEMWRYTADRYRDQSVVVGYDLMCEPNPNDVALGFYDPEDFYPKYAGSTYDWNQFYPRIVAGIREVDSNMPILVSGMGWGAASWLPYLDIIEDPRIVYTVHQYEPQSQYTHQQPPPAVNTYPGEFDLNWDGQPDTFDRSWLEDFLTILSDFQQEHGVPVAVNEFGVIRWVPNAADFMRDEMDIFEGMGINHALWVWNPDWASWSESSTEFNFSYGGNPENLIPVVNDLQTIILEFWARNKVRPSNFGMAAGSVTGRGKLANVTRWLYLIGDDPEMDLVAQIAASEYDMVVFDFIPSEKDSTDYPMAEVVAQLHNASHPKLVIAYIDIGQAENYRTYWQPEWRVGNPEWIVGEDPDGWEGNFPVAFWYDEWQTIWLGEGGLMSQILSAGFDGVYLDWVEAYSDENVIGIAEKHGVEPVQEMIRWVGEISAFVKGRCPDCEVIAQNAAELVEHDEYVTAITALAQEQVWFDGGADNDPEGDCPLPRTQAEVDMPAYYKSLSPECRRQYDEFPESTLHVSSEEYLDYLKIAQQKDLPVFTVDYALQPENIAWVYQTAQGLGFIPFVSNRGLERYIMPVP
jgi:cysteinyl-tRNA synthetase